MLILNVLQGPDKGRRFQFPDDEPQLIGRSSEAIALQDQAISRRHCELTPDDGRWYINDLRSANGTYVNAIRMIGRRRLQAGDQIRVGNTLLLYGMEPQTVRSSALQAAEPEEIAISLEGTFESNDESMIMAVPEPSSAAVLQLKLIYELTGLIATYVDRTELLEHIIDLIFENFEADRGFILIQDRPELPLDPVVVRHRNQPHAKEHKKITYSRTIIQHVMRKGQGVLSTNAMADQRFAGGDSVQGMRIRSVLCVPIKFKDQLFGVIHLDSQVANYTFTDDQLRLLTAVGVHTGLAMANAQLYTAQLNQARLAVVGETVASLAHSIRNIIQGLRGGADVVEIGMRKKSMKVVTHGWDIVSRNLDRIHRLMLNMISYSKQRQPELEIQNLNPLLEEVVLLVQKQFDQRQVALLTDFEADMPPIPVDSSGIHQAVLNLLNNALDATEDKVGAVSLRTEYDDAKNIASISITDNGVGISKRDQARLFEPFHSTKGLRGTGLGLVVTHKIASEHGGSVIVESTPGVGSTFTLLLPISIDEQAPALADTLGPRA